MRATITFATLQSFIERFASEDDAVRLTALEDFGAYAGTGTPANDAQAEDLGPDYVCALDDGRIVAWGGDFAIKPGVVGREIVVA